MNEKWTYFYTDYKDDNLPFELHRLGSVYEPLEIDVDELIGYWYNSSIRSFYPFYCSTNVGDMVIYYKRDLNKLLAKHRDCYFNIRSQYADIFDTYTAEHICTVAVVDIKYLDELIELHEVKNG